MPGLRGQVRAAALVVWAGVWAAEAREVVVVVDRVRPGCGASPKTKMYLTRYAGTFDCVVCYRKSSLLLLKHCFGLLCFNNIG